MDSTNTSTTEETASMLAAAPAPAQAPEVDNDSSWDENYCWAPI